MKRLVGYTHITSKKGVDYCIAHIVGDPGMIDKSKGFVGESTETVWLSGDLVNVLKPADVGKEIQVQYEINGRYTNIVGVVVK